MNKKIRSVVFTITAIVMACSLKSACNPSFTYSVGSGGSVSFVSTSTGTTANTYYYWDFNDGATGGVNLNTTSHVYSTDNVYVVTLYLTDSMTSCSSSLSHTIVVNTAGCTASLSINSSQGPNGLVNFSSSLGNLYNHAWSFGDGSTGSNFFTSHTYTANGVYNVTLTASTASGLCTYTASKTLTVTIVSCSLNASFTKTLTGALLNVQSTSTGTTPSTIYNWTYGDNSNGGGNSSSHTYTTNGTYTIKLNVVDSSNFFCSDLDSQVVVVTGAGCPVIASYALTKDSFQVLTWNAYPTLPWNTSAVSWSWGDGSSTSSWYPSHTYSAAGTYSICMSVTVACGSSTTFCTSSSIYKVTGGNGMIQLNVIKTGGPSVSLPEMAEGELTLGIRPNPGSGEFTAELDYWNDGPLTIVIYSILGEEVYKISAFPTNGSLKQELKLDDLPAGTYYLKAGNGQQSSGTRLVICR